MATIDASTVGDEELGSWLGAVEVLRLLLGTQLDVTEDMVEVNQDDPRLDQFTVYQYLSMLQGEIVDALVAQDQADRGCAPRFQRQDRVGGQAGQERPGGLVVEPGAGQSRGGLDRPEAEPGGATASQTFTSRSLPSPDEARREPSGLKATRRTPLGWPR